MKSEYRVNLCFDLENPKHKIVYDYLMAAGRQKTSVAVELMARQLASDTKWKNAQEEREARLTEHFERSVQRSHDEFMKVLRDIQQSGTMIVQPSKPETQAADNDVMEDDMSDDAFAAAMALLNF